MKKILSIILFLAAVIYFIPACDIVDEPYLKPVGESGDTTIPVEKIRKVLVEDYTGQKCPNCPEAAAVSQSLIATYGEQVVVIAIHAGHYANPDASGDFTADFRTPEGTELNDYNGISNFGYPMGMINRAEYNGFPVVLKDDWEAAVQIQLEKDAQAGIKLTNTFESGTRNLDCTAETEFFEEMDGTYNICIFIIESGILSPQQTESGPDLAYVHDHMLRGSMNGTWGEAVGSDGQAVTGSKLTNSYSITLPAQWTVENCSVVAFIYNTDTREVIQAEELAIAE
jgi:hypothetical protein